MTFEEEFPSLKGLMYNDEGEIYDFIFRQAIQKHCLDKQRVKEVIEKAREYKSPFKSNGGDLVTHARRWVLNELEKELGL